MNFRTWLAESSLEDNRRLVHSLFQRGIDKKDASVLGYHGTSVQTIRSAIQRGFIPVAKGLHGIFGSELHGPGSKEYGIHIVPNPDNPTVRGMAFRTGPIEDPHAEALSWAKHVADRHHLFDLLGMDLDKASHHAVADNIQTGHDPISSIRRIKRGPPNPDAIMAGVVLAISDRAANDFRVALGGDGNDLNIQTRALPLDYIVGIEPHNDEAYEWLDSLGFSS